MQEQGLLQYHKKTKTWIYNWTGYIQYHKGLIKMRNFSISLIILLTEYRRVALRVTT